MLKCVKFTKNWTNSSDNWNSDLDSVPLRHMWYRWLVEQHVGNLELLLSPYNHARIWSLLEDHSFSSILQVRHLLLLLFLKYKVNIDSIITQYNGCKLTLLKHCDYSCTHTNAFPFYCFKSSARFQNCWGRFSYVLQKLKIKGTYVQKLRVQN